MFKTLPAAEKHRQEAAQADEGGDLGDDLYGSEDEVEDWTEEANGGPWTGVNASEVPDSTKGDIKDESQAYLDFLSEEAKKFGALAEDDDDSVMDEDNFFESPLDKFDPYGAFRNSMTMLQQQQPQLYDSLTNVLEQNDKDFLQRTLQTPPQQSQH